MGPGGWSLSVVASGLGLAYLYLLYACTRKSTVFGGSFSRVGTRRRCERNAVLWPAPLPHGGGPADGAGRFGLAHRVRTLGAWRAGYALLGVRRRAVSVCFMLRAGCCGVARVMTPVFSFQTQKRDTSVRWWLLEFVLIIYSVRCVLNNELVWCIHYGNIRTRMLIWYR
jgi:hypothetical protein